MRKLLSKHRKLAGETSWSLIDQLVTIVGSTVTFLLLGRSLGAAAYGAYISLYGLLGPFFSFGHAGVALSILDHLVREKEDPRRVTRSCLGLATWFCTLSTPLIVLLGRLVVHGGMSVTTVAALVTADYLLMGLLMAMAAVVQAVDGFNPATRLRIMTKVVRLAVVVSLRLLGHLNLANLALTQLVTLAVQLVIADRKTTRVLNGHVWPGRVERAHAKSMAVYSIGISGSAVQTDGDKPVLTAFNHAADAGRYGAAYRLVLLGLAPASALIVATHVDFLDVESNAHNQLRKATRFAIVSGAYGLLFGAGLWIGAPLVPKLLGADFEGTATMIRWLSPLVMLRGAGTFPMNGLLGLGRNGLRTTILVANAVLSLALYLALIPAHSWRGAIVGTLVSEISLFAMGWIALWRCQRRYEAHREPRVREAVLT